MPSHNSVMSTGVSVTTTDATKTTIATFDTAPNKTYMVWGKIIGRGSANSAGYNLIGTFKNIDGTLTQVGSTTDGGTHEDDAAWAATLETSGDDIIATVTGKAATTVVWRAALDIWEV